jgi:hypothetical protein
LPTVLVLVLVESWSIPYGVLAAAALGVLFPGFDVV